MSFTWQGGRQLASVTRDGVTTSYTYNENGLCTTKTTGTETTNYYYSSDVLTGLETTGYSLHFHYDENGGIIGYTKHTETSDSEYFYVKNLQGDVLQILDSTGNTAAQYSYDAWGNILTVTGPEAGTNPIRYRGYYFDTETGLYYLQSRYYDAGICRFLNADSINCIGADKTLISYNSFVYCINDPLNRIDGSGNLSTKNKIKIGIGAVALGVAIALTVATGGGATAVAIGVAKMVGSVALSTATSAGIGYLSNGKEGAVDGACNGFMFGSLSACGGATLKYSEVKAATTGSPNAIGQIGEELAGFDPKAKQPIDINGRTRIPDALTDNTLTEVKNVRYISNTQQLRVFADYAKSTGRRLVLYVRPTTKIAHTVIEAGWEIKHLW